MKFFKPKSKISSTISVILVTLIIAGMSNWFRDAAKDAVIDTTLSQMREIGNRQEYAIEDEIGEAVTALKLIAEYSVTAGADKDNILDFFATQSQVNLFDFIYYIDLDGNAISTEDSPLDFSDNTSFSKALENDYYITVPQVSFELNQVAFGISVPVIENGEPVAVLFAEISMDDFFTAYNLETVGKGDVFLVDTSLNFIFSTSEGHTGHTQIPDGDIQEMGLDNVQKAQMDIINGQNGAFYYDYYGVNKVMVYTPIAMTEWALAINVESKVISSEIETAVNQLNFACSLIYWFLIALICYSSYVHVRSMKNLERVAFYDALTGLPNLEKFKILVDDMIKKNPDSKFTMQKMDISRFQAINEVYGFENGNLVLKKIAETAGTITEKTFICARVGVDEFLMFAGNGFLDGEDSSREEYERKFKSLLPELQDHEFTFRYGRYFLENGENDIIDIINKTSLAHNMAKKNPSRKTWDYNSTFRKDVRQNVEISNKKKAAILNEEFKVFLQPKFSIHDDTLIGAEALVRWIESNGNMIFPNDFIPLFENDGFITELDSYILEHTCQAIRKWMDDGLGGLTVSVNLSRVNLGNPNIVNEIIEIVDKYNVPHKYIEIELTESASSEQENSLELLYKQLRSHGFMTSIDDFGAGYSSLSMLKSLNVSTLKLDRSFFTSEKYTRRDNMLIDSIVKMAHNLGMYVVAEGIETAEQIELLRSMNCDAVQGYFYAKPMPVSDFEDKYRELMKQNQSITRTITPIIQHINDTKYATTLVPCGIIVSKVDRYCTIEEANESFFDIIGFTRKEVANAFNNRGVSLLHPEDKDKLSSYFLEKIQERQTSTFDFVCRVSTKDNTLKIVQFSGKISKNEKGKRRMYFSITDLTSFAETTNELQKEKEFNTIITTLIDSDFFDFDLESKTIRFSKNFADRFEIPDTIVNFTETELGQQMLPKSMAFFNTDPAHTPRMGSGQFSTKLPNGEMTTYKFNYKTIYYDDKLAHRVIGKMSEIV